MQDTPENFPACVSAVSAHKIFLPEKILFIMLTSKTVFTDSHVHHMCSNVSRLLKRMLMHTSCSLHVPKCSMSQTHCSKDSCAHHAVCMYQMCSMRACVLHQFMLV
ncbi:hypothetical protein DUNSADRAFT_1975 [Dunaliella salina]|uniref:Encoded protein n=1 Tax=Dunaliella salina TaxID=3046 RepID=A0ABQ7FWS2_DUNSA|nr:hypothetical protein DUNSADRAFT_1975 [Dunaliella salina]|eukprot:KAF5826809.1 hypothetical protein DUNSADRAFT_1975 [Dunaliella salina]